MADTGIDDLPEALLLHILSFLLTRDAIRSSLISRRWRNLWHHVPVLYFDIHPFHSRRSRKSCSETRNSFSDFITQTLLLRPPNAPLNSFHLVFDYRKTGRLPITVDSWVRHAINAGVTVLNLDFESWIISKAKLEDGESSDDDLHDEAFGYYEFHLSELRNNCRFRVLKLVNSEIILPKASSGGLLSDEYSSLCSLSLDGVVLESEELFRLVSGLANLEYLSIDGLDSLTDFKIYSKKLRELNMGFFMFDLSGPSVGSFDISCPSLKNITFNMFCVENYCAKDLSSLVEALVRFRTRIKEDLNCWWELMKILTGTKALITDNTRLDKENWLEFLGTEDSSDCLVFKNLSHLELRTGYTKYDLVGIASFLEICPVLETLVLDYHFKDDGKLSEDFSDEPFVLHIPCLKQVKLKNYKGTESELFLVESLKKHNVVLGEIIAYSPIANGKILPPFVL